MKRQNINEVITKMHTPHTHTQAHTRQGKCVRTQNAP